MRPNRIEIIQKNRIAIGNDVLSRTHAPVTRLMDDAPAFAHPHQVAIVVHRTGMNEVNLHAQILPNVNLMIQFRISPTEPRWKPNHANFFNQ